MQKLSSAKKTSPSNASEGRVCPNRSSLISAAAMRRSLPDRSEVDLFWGLHFALAMAHHTIRESERLTRLSDGKCDLDDVEGIIERIVAVSVMALTGAVAEKKAAAKLVARDAR